MAAHTPSRRRTRTTRTARNYKVYTYNININANTLARACTRELMQFACCYRAAGAAPHVQHKRRAAGWLACMRECFAWRRIEPRFDGVGSWLVTLNSALTHTAAAAVLFQCDVVRTVRAHSTQ